ncbi:hypothetical protein [Sphingomonas sp. MMS24-J13]|uniref:hypothetical protein n=1 Tax=Sphingomonas sp. MMS24-J13 TaxID=3238686 RepID=UPI003850D820
MIGFFEPLRARTLALRVEDITEIGPLIELSTGDRYHIVRLRAGQVEAYAGEVSALFERPVQLLPADHATKLLYVSADIEGAWVTPAPLIGWALCLDGIIRPVTPAGVDDGHLHPPYGWFVETDGRIYACGDTGRENAFDSEDELKAAVFRWWQNDQPKPSAEGDKA